MYFDTTFKAHSILLWALSSNYRTYSSKPVELSSYPSSQRYIKDSDLKGKKLENSRDVKSRGFIGHTIKTRFAYPTMNLLMVWVMQ